MIDGCKNNLEKSSMAKVSEHVPSKFLISTISSFKGIENIHDVYRGKDYMKTFCESFRKHAVKIINFAEKKEGIINKQTAEII